MQHKFKQHRVDPNAEILILGTFYPDIDNGADFFYGRPRNYFWRILPTIFEQINLKHSPLVEKRDFLRRNKIDVQDIILALRDVPAGQETNYSDIFIDRLVDEWFNTTGLIDSLKNLRAVYFTRKTFQNIPNIYNKIFTIRNYCLQQNIRFCVVETPARFANPSKIDKWHQTIITKNICSLPTMTIGNRC